MSKYNTSADFITAFWKIYDKKKIEKISIREICQLAGYNRTTFYAYYQNIYDLLEKAVSAMIVPLDKTTIPFNDPGAIFNSGILEKHFLTMFQTEDRRIELLFQNKHDHVLAERIKAEWIAWVKEEGVVAKADFQDLQYFLEYQISAVFGLVRYWYQTGKKLSEQELIEMIYYISTQGVLSIVRKKVVQRSVKKRV